MITPEDLTARTALAEDLSTKIIRLLDETPAVTALLAILLLAGTLIIEIQNDGDPEFASGLKNEVDLHVTAALTPEFIDRLEQIAGDVQ